MNKSEELAKLLGIEPKQYDGCKLEKCVSNERYYPCTTDCPHTLDIIIYPDFTQPDNFVKLLELIIFPNNEIILDYTDTNNSFSASLGGCFDNKDFPSYAETIQEAFINELIKKLNKHQSLEYYQQQAQQIKWRYCR